MTENNGTNMVMPVAPTNGFGNAGFGGFGGDGWWIILLFLFLGWSNNGNNGNAYLPYVMSGLNTGNEVQTGFNQAALTSGLGDIQSALTASFANAETAANARQIANMQQDFASQTAITGGMTNLASQLASCCCENRLASADLKYTIATENCADRQAVNEGVRDILTNQNAGIQRILDQMCNDKIDAKNEKIADLERQLTMANLAASQGAQTAAILANNEAQTTALEQYLAPVPRPAYIVQNPNCCANSNCGCGAY